MDEWIIDKGDCGRDPAIPGQLVNHMLLKKEFTSNILLKASVCADKSQNLFNNK